MTNVTRRTALRLVAAVAVQGVVSTRTVRAEGFGRASEPGTDTLPSGCVGALQGQLSALPSDLVAEDDTSLQVGTRVPTYLATIGDGYAEGAAVYPILVDGKLVLWVVVSQGGSLQLSTAYVEEAASLVESRTPFAFVYDDSAAYLLEEGGEATQIGSYEHVEQRGSLVEKGLASVSLASYCEPLVLRRPVLTANGYYSCTVGKVLQFPPYKGSKICWAASCACIVNRIKGKSLTAQSVARVHYGTDYNHALTWGEEVGILKTYGVSVTRVARLSDNTFIKNFHNGRPLYSDWYVNGHSGHAMVVYGKNVISGVLSIMDPEYGFCTASAYGSSYRMTSLYSQATLTCAAFTACYVN